jgi:hypothetical protein
MKWERTEQELVFTAASGIGVYKRALGWRCTSCGLTHWASDERPQRPDGGCWGCGGRDEEWGKDAPAHGPTGREALGTLRNVRLP